MSDFPVIQHEGEELPWVGLKLDSHLANTVEDIDRNIESALSLNLTGLRSLLKTQRGPVSVVGSGPSLKENWQKIADVGGDIIACNAACQFLLARGVVPKYMFCFDADPLMLEFITPHPDITYLMASRCPPKAFEMLKDCNVVVWNAGGDEHIQEILERRGIMEPLIAGGSAAVTRCMLLAQAIGYNPIHLWGVDSSFVNGDTHIRKSTTEEKKISILVNGKTFLTAPWMCAQAEDFKVLAPVLRERYGVKLVVHGYGLIPHLAEAMYFDVDGQSRALQWIRSAATKARILWPQL